MYSASQGQNAREFSNLTSSYDERSSCKNHHDFSHEQTLVGTTRYSQADSIAQCTYSQPVSSQDRFVNESAHDERSFSNNQHDFSHERTDFDTTNYSHADSTAVGSDQRDTDTNWSLKT